MAGLREIALGVATVLRSKSAPDPLPVSFAGQSPDEAAFLLRSILQECADAEIGLVGILADPAIVKALREVGPTGAHFNLIKEDPSRAGRIDIFRTVKPGAD